MKIDYAKRRRVMERSMHLGHCICDPQRPCPCDVFRNEGICPCAGERPDPIDLSQFKLTSSVRNAGCASKIAPADLEAVLARLPQVQDDAVISGLAAADDAAIYRIGPDLCLVQTVDVFAPCVNDPHLFGRICAANCLSDIYAMGGEPRTALSILAFPSESLDGEVMFQMLAGAMETLAEAGVALIGGHSIKDSEIKLGFAITGVIDPELAATLDNPRVGDTLVLTKPLGMGVLTFAEQINRGHSSGLAAAAAAMATLNRGAAEAMMAAGASACTDVTGFGLFAHLVRMLRPHGLAARIEAAALPAFEGVLEALRDQVIPGAVERNREFVGADLRVESGVDEACVQLGFDAQTSGGLLIAIAPERLDLLREELARRGVHAYVVGQLTTRMDCAIQIGQSTPETSPVVEPDPLPALDHDSTDSTAAVESHGTGCCADVFGTAASAGSIVESQRAFGAMLRSVQTAGALDEKTKELILFSLIIHSRCASCFTAHYERACELGISRAELDEAAWCAVAMGGAPIKMFYQECLARVDTTSSPTMR